jgi:hypothetical protein
MVERFGPERTVAAFRGEHRKDANPASLLGRMEQGLKEGDRRLRVVEETGS